MPFSPDIISKLTIRLNQVKALSFNDSQAVLAHYPDVFNAVINEELAQEIRLLELIINTEENDPNVLFEQRCQERALQNKGSRLSMLEMPFGACNQLYFDFIGIINPSATTENYLRLLLPQAVFYVTPEYNLVLDNVELNLVKKPLKELSEPFHQERLSHLVQADDIIFDLNDIRTYDFKWHQDFFRLIEQEYPMLAKLIYEHNSELKTLAGHLRMLSDNGQILLDVLNEFIKELRLGGERITGQPLASIQASIAVANFSCYINALSVDTKNDILAFSTSDEKIRLSDVLNDLNNLECVETAAEQIDNIVRHQKALKTPALYQVPNIPAATYDKLNKQYHKGISISIVSEQTNTILPHCYLEKISNRLSIKKMPDIVLSLLSFPTEMYRIILKEKIDYISNNGVLKLVDILNSGIFSPQQMDAIYQVILNRFDVKKALYIATTTNSLDLFMKSFIKKNQDEILGFMIKENEIDECALLDHLAFRCPLILKELINSISQENKQMLIKDTLLLTYATQNCESLKIIYELYSKEACMDAIENADIHNFKSNLLENIDSLKFILSIYNRQEIIDLWQKNDDTNLFSLLDVALKKPLSLPLILPFYSQDMIVDNLLSYFESNDEIMRLYINRKDEKKGTSSFDLIMNFLSEEQRKKVIISRSYYGKTLLHELIYCDKKFIDLINYFSDKKDFFNALTIQNNNGKTVIYKLLTKNYRLLKQLFELMPEMPWLSVFQKKDINDQTLLQQLTTKKFNLTTIEMLDSMPLDLRFICILNIHVQFSQCLKAILYNEQDYYDTKDSVYVLLKDPFNELTNEAKNDLLITYLACPELKFIRSLDKIMKYLLNRISAEEILTGVSIKNNSCHTMTHYPQLFEKCFPLLTESQKIAALLQEKGNYKTIFEFILEQQLPLIPIILGSLTEQSIMRLVNEKEGIGFSTILYKFIDNEWVIKAFLSPLSLDMRWSVIMHKCMLNVITFAYKSIAHPATLKVILDSLSEEQRLELLTQKTGLGSQFIYQIGRNQPSCLMFNRQYASLPTSFFWEKNPPRDLLQSALIKRDRSFSTSSDELEPQAKRTKP